MLALLPIGSKCNLGLAASSVARIGCRGETSTRLELLTVANEVQGTVDVLTTEDLVVGAAIAVTLAFTASFLQGRRSQNDFVLWEKLPDENISEANTTETRVFDEDS